MEAVLEGGVVKVGDLVVEATLFSEGEANSQGLLFMDEYGVYYFAKTTPDLKTTIEKASDALADAATALTQAATALTTIAAVPSGWVTPPASVAANVAQITAKVAEIQTGVTALNTLKGALK